MWEGDGPPRPPTHQMDGENKATTTKKKKKEKKKNISPSLALVQPRKTIPFITERLLMGPKESNQQINSFATRADPDQAALVRAAWSGSTLFAYGNMIRYDPTLCSMYQPIWKFIYLIIHSGWSLFMKERVQKWKLNPYPVNIFVCGIPHMGKGPWIKVSSKRLENLGIELGTDFSIPSSHKIMDFIRSPLNSAFYFFFNQHHEIPE